MNITLPQAKALSKRSVAQKGAMTPSVAALVSVLSGVGVWGSLKGRRKRDVTSGLSCPSLPLL
jgi:hypothetical protein